MKSPATQIARLLAERVEAACRHYLSNGRREGRYWLVGDRCNTPGRSLFLRLVDSPDGKGRAGKWTDAQSGEHGDLLDIIAATRATRTLRETLDEARRFLSMPVEPQEDREPTRRPTRAPTGSPEAARRLFAATQPLRRTTGDRYLRGRLLFTAANCTALRFHPHCWYRPSKDDAPDTPTAFPGIIAAVTDLSGTITGVHRTWLDPTTAGKAAVSYPRRAMGHLLEHAVRLGPMAPIMVAGEGIETMLSLREAIPALSPIAGLSGAHLAAIAFPPVLRRLYVARDDDPAGTHAVTTLAERADAAGIEMVPLEPRCDDFNTDLRRLGLDRLRHNVGIQLRPEDRRQFLLDVA
ncbi:Toprim domain-containing protein [Hephaestia caeni]|uniref:Toprim domain-containing protein n=1 Tax=Hephaestia caeni TaxID=645617 RepID=A0A397P449_9SPHN|nr:toprim domain-containing protein [Hephaestia caeni]RIA44346.1 Toprim domain-containing protein [Hephaestia caeni]